MINEIFIFNKITFNMKKIIFVITVYCFITGLFIIESCRSGQTEKQSNMEEQHDPPKQDTAKNKSEWISLFDGKTLNGWKASHAGAFKVENGMIIANGPTSHLYYVGAVMDHNFKNFEFKIDVLTKPHANSGIYFHTRFQEDGYPDNGFEVQVNNSADDWKRTGCLYDIADFGHKYAKDNEWFTIYIKVEGKNVIVKVNDREVINWTQPGAYVAPEGHPGRYISSGTFALQEHTKGEIIYFKNMMVRPLP